MKHLLAKYRGIIKSILEQSKKLGIKLDLNLNDI